ncbi:hypothetical protein Bcav_4129 [Beutenbergia cavernae DSM 12333]|uniref:DUF998 domain-containing protein n=1 Tax=Beutenbergia cavernae (strain ATCC BAA-8 / DSM 12333 / CCUG 43141 / JCM 11478 / NBRC 16432 / NCIMB 13614 / HKI 0122) TaxID=471853 RepID=C5C611_BEUC1|nr:DUF998 domain-containing protein [Beutenbergia cavernae]ACQ82369.1 hypothetical protein Bcav_4129 [Beutenbergia cavernae DSM 12333]
MTTLSTSTTAPIRPTHGTPSSTLRLLTAGAAAGPFFYASASVQMLVRDGFDLRVHPISQLATGDLGWIQTATFALTGLGVIALAVAHRRVVPDGVGRRAVPVLLAIAGLGFVLAGLFVMDPQHGFPLGTPDGPAPATSWHAVVHSSAAVLAFTALAVAYVVLTVRAVRERQVTAAFGHGLVALVLLAPVSPTSASLQVAATGVVAFAWTTAYALRLRRRVATGQQTHDRGEAR